MGGEPEGREPDGRQRRPPRPARNERLRRARIERNLTQADVAEQLGTSVLTVSRWELGSQSPLPYHRERLCRLYGKTPAELGLLPGAEAEAEEAGPEPLEPAPVDAAAAAPPPGEPEAERDAPPASADERSRRDLLGQVRRYWIHTELEAATGELPHLVLALAERPAAVDDPVRVTQPLEALDRPLPGGTAIGDVYRRLGGQLLILGDPGAGKTTLLLHLASELLSGVDERLPDPMPVVFHLASWAAERRPLDRWLVEELYRRYGVARRLGQLWVTGGQILPLLDGLDEVAEPHRAACVAAINEFHGEHGQLPMVVCCRTAWYEALSNRLALRGAVVILPLSEHEVGRYLSEGGDRLAGLQTLLTGDHQLRELVTTPLFLTIAALTYRDAPAAAAGASGSLAARRRQVVQDYVEARLRSPAEAPPYPRERTLAWLGWLARTLRDHDQSVLSFDWMQPDWLPNTAMRWVVMYGVTAIVGLVFGAAVGVNWGIDWGVSVGLAAALPIAVTTGVLATAFHVILAHESRIVPAEQLRWSWAGLRRLPSRLTLGLAMGLSAGLLFGLVLGLVVAVRPDVLAGARSAGAAPTTGSVSLLGGLATGVVSGAVNGAELGLLIGLTVGVLDCLHTRSAVVDLAPGRSVRASGRNAFLGGALGAAVFGSGFGLVYGPWTSATGPLAHQAARALHLSGIYWPVVTPNDIVLAVLIGASVIGLRRGGGAYLRHRVLVWMLALCDCAPRDYVDFLEYTARLILLQRRSGGYEFVHRVLLDYFADQEAPGGGPPAGPSPSRAASEAAEGRRAAPEGGAGGTGPRAGIRRTAAGSSPTTASR